MGGDEDGALVEDEGREIGEPLPSVPDPVILATVGVPDGFDARHIVAAWALSEGVTQEEAGQRAGVRREAVSRWVNHLAGFAELVRRLVPYTGLAQRSGQLFEVKRLYQWLTGQRIDKALRKSDAVHLVRLAGELGAAERPAVPPGAQLAQQFIIGTQINVQATVMPPPAGGDSAVEGRASGRGGPDDGAVVEGEVRELEPEKRGDGEEPGVT